MHPKLLRLPLGPGFDLHTYGLLIAAGFLIGIWLAGREARRAGLPAQRIMDLCFWILLAALAGSRLLFILTNLGEYARACTEAEGFGGALWGCTKALHVWEGGLVFYGGFLTATACTVYYVRRHQLPFFRVADVLVTSVAIGHCFGRLGCYAAGCCFGKLCALEAIGARFPRESLAFHELATRGQLAEGAELTPALHATQLYEAAGVLALFLLLLSVRARKRFDGQVFLTYLVAYPMLRSTIELFRGDPARKFPWPVRTPAFNRALGLVPGELTFVSTSQLISLLVAAAAVVLILVITRRRTAATTAA